MNDTELREPETPPEPTPRDAPSGGQVVITPTLLILGLIALGLGIGLGVVMSAASLVR